MKIEINGKLPKGFKIVNGKVVRTMAEGGNVNKTLGPIDRDQANLEAEKGETALTDLTNDGSFELYNIGGKRHTEGGTPLNLPEQSFVYSDTRSMKLTVEELKSLGISSKKKMTPAEASKKFPLNEYIEVMENQTSDKVSIDTAEEMIDKNKIKLSQIAFLQESKKDFADGLPLAAYPFLISKGINPQEMEAKIAEKNGPQQNPSPEMSQEQMAMGPQQGNLQQFTGPPQGAPPMPPQGGMPPMAPPMGKYGTETHTMPDGTIHPGATHEEYMAMMGQSEYKTGGNVGVCPTCGKKLPCGCKYKMGGDLPKAQWGNLGVSDKFNKTSKAILNWKPINYLNPFAGKITDNWLVSHGGIQNDLKSTRLNLGDQSLGLINTDQGYFGDKPSIENINIGSDYQGLGLGTQLYNKGLQVGTGQGRNFNEPFAEGLISADQSINPMESPEKTLGIWKYFDKELVQIKPWTTNKEKMWTDAGDHDFTQYLNTDKKTGAVTYTGPEVRLLGLNEAGKAKVALSEKFFRDLMIEGQGTGPNGSSPILNWETILSEGAGPDWHSPIGRSIVNKFKTSFGREPRIGNGAEGDQTFQDYNKAGLYLMLAIGSFTFFNQDKIDTKKEQEEYDLWLKEEFDELVEKGIVPADKYEHWKENPHLYTIPKDDVPDYLDDSTDMGLDIKRLGGQPFKTSALRKFTDGGDPTHPENQMYGSPPPGTVQGGMLNEVNVFDNMPNPTNIGPGEQMLMNMGEQRRLLLQKYSGIESAIQQNPNILEDPEQGGMIQAQIMAIEEQIQAIDTKTSAIEKQLLQQRLHLDPFSEDGQSAQAQYGVETGGHPAVPVPEAGSVDPFEMKDPLFKFVYGGSLPKYQKKGQTYGDWLKEKGYPLPDGANPDLTWDPTHLNENGKRGAFKGTKTVKGERGPVSESTFSFRNTDGSLASPNPYFNEREDNSRQFINGVENPDYDPALEKSYNKGADEHDAFYQIMQGDNFGNVRKNWMDKTLKLRDGKYKYDGTTEQSHYGVRKTDAGSKAAYAEFKNMDETALFANFNHINKLFRMAKTSGHAFTDAGSAADLQTRLDEAAKKMGLPPVTRGQMMAYQTMYGALAIQKEQGSADDKKLLGQVNINFGTNEGGIIELKGGNISDFDGYAGNNSAEQMVGVADNVEDVVVPEIHTVDCTEERKKIEMEKCIKQKKEFNPETCGCKEIPPTIEDVEKPEYETFDQDDLAVQVKSGQFPTLINPTRQATPDPAMVDPMYVDPRQQLSTLEATAAAAIRAGANPTAVMGSMQDQSEKVINKHEALNTKIYNNAQNINVSALNQFTGNKMDNEKQYMDETAMAMGNYQTEYKDAEDALLDAEQSQMSNADEMYIRNLENPNYWFSPKRHNIEFYNEKNIDGTITPGRMTYDEAYQDCAGKFSDEKEINNCIKMKTGQGGGSNNNLNVTPGPVQVSLGTEVKGFSKRQADLARSRKKLNKWITGH